MEFDVIVRLLRSLGARNVRYVVVGGVAVNLHGLARATLDVDLFLDPDEANVARLKDSLRDVFADPSIDEIAAADLAGAYPTVRYVSPDGSVVVDLLGRLGEAFRFEDIEAEPMEVEGVSVPVATPRMLYRMKKDTLRPVDRMDAEALRRKFRLAEE